MDRHFTPWLTWRFEKLSIFVFFSLGRKLWKNFSGEFRALCVSR
jgi:hypothetical protein